MERRRSPLASRALARLVVVIAVAAVAAVGLAACGEATDSGSATTVVGDVSGAPDGAGDGGADGFGEPVTVVVPNSPGSLSVEGTQRVMTALVGDGPNAYLGGPDRPVTVRFSALDGDSVGTVDATWLTTDVSTLGLYVAPYDFDRAGLWEVTVESGGQELGRALIEVVEDSPIPEVGDPAPATPTPTGTTAAEIAAISTDVDPDPALYRLSLDDAVANGRPTVVAFATPAFCRTALCGPTLEAVKQATAGRAGIDVVHVEPFDLEQAPAGVLEPIAAMAEWGLVSEPWVFVVDADGLIAARFEGIMGRGELAAALDRLQ